MKDVVIVRGLPGSGKSTFAELLIVGRNGIVIENDQYMYVDGKYEWSKSKMKNAHSYCFNKFRESLENELDIIVLSNVFVSESSFNKFADLAKEYGYKVTTLVIENRNDTENIHDVPKESIDSMRNAFKIKL